MSIVRTRRYLNELAAIGDFIAQRNPRAAHRIVNQIDGVAERLLSRNRFVGRRGDIQGTRELVVTGTPYIVAYRVTETSVELLFVQHGAREWPTDA
ncbi:type II toxin-antitoxin system RelE/ParE family toxin [Methylopila sp. M107]|uniref:type II toxin-antitoxin system RelE/ParE family toxin n=1 Tax=Methylopila sp. M107 TaxID=1101190 RepID=UPI00036421C3|nr:type II toxin-antitoxin system RelE/ParE family toxin [Methylopila sp. M107]